MPLAALAQPPGPAPAAGACAPARLLHSVLPVAPHLEPGDSVDVVLLLDVDEQGRVTRVTVSEPGGEAFDRAAEVAARQFVFAPARLAGKPVAVQVTYRGRFVGRPAPANEPATTESQRATGDAAAHARAAADLARAPAQPLASEVLSRGDRAPQPGVTV